MGGVLGRAGWARTGGGRLVALAAGAGVAQAAYRVLCAKPPGPDGTWERTNHRLSLIHI